MKYSILLLTFIVCYLSSVGAQYHRSCPKPCQSFPGCNTREKCAFGRENGSCNCCSRCLKGQGEVCGGPGNRDGNCAEGYFCDKFKSRRLSYTNPSGVCELAHLICILPCDQVLCPKVYCELGTTKDICGCCDVCLKGKGDFCGGRHNGFGKCASGLYCDESGVVFDESPGVCKVWNILTISSHHNNYRRYRH